MNRRSAMFVAAGLVLTMAVAAAAWTMGVAGPTTASAVAVHRRAQPKVRKVVDTVTIHRKAKGGQQVTSVPAAPAVASRTTTTGSASHHVSSSKPEPVAETASEAPEPVESESPEAPEPSEPPGPSESPEPWHDDD